MGAQCAARRSHSSIRQSCPSTIRATRCRRRAIADFQLPSDALMLVPIEGRAPDGWTRRQFQSSQLGANVECITAQPRTHSSSGVSDNGDDPSCAAAGPTGLALKPTRTAAIGTEMLAGLWRSWRRLISGISRWIVREHRNAVPFRTVGLVGHAAFLDRAP